MCVCMHVCMFVCACVCVYVFINVCAYVGVSEADRWDTECECEAGRCEAVYVAGIQ